MRADSSPARAQVGDQRVVVETLQLGFAEHPPINAAHAHDASRLDGHDVPAFEFRGAADGPRVSVIGGIHGCEYSSIAAVTRLMREPRRDVNGTVVGVPVVSMDSFTQRSPFVVPADGKNLNRAFPGDPDGTYTDRLAHDIFTQLIEPADAVLDLHGGDLVEALEPFAIYHDARSRDLALAFSLPYVVDSTRLARPA